MACWAACWAAAVLSAAVELTAPAGWAAEPAKAATAQATAALPARPDSGPSDIAWVRMNQDAKINVTAYDSSVYGSLKGKVVAISPDATLNERTGESFYTVRVTTSDRLLDPNGEPLDIGAGMIADASLLGDKRSVMSYILAPFTRLGERALREH